MLKPLSGQKPKLIIATGGTGGHIFPGIAVAEKWQESGGEVLFVGSLKGREASLVPENGFALRAISVTPLKGGGLIRKIMGLAKIPAAIFATLKILRQEKPAAVLGMGGYVSGPTCLASRLLGLPTAVADQNARPGITNRWLGRLANRIFISFQESAPYFAAHKVVWTGNPVRAALTPTPYAKTTGPFHLFITGGSQGAVGMNKKIMASLDLIREIWPRLEVKHQTSTLDAVVIESFYKNRNITAVVAPFFADMASAYAWSHLVICRAGASTITELALCGRPAIMIPLPTAADDHQTKNAEAFVTAGGGWMVAQKEGNELMSSRAQELTRLPPPNP